MYQFTFARLTTTFYAALIQRVTVTAPNSVAAWSIFEALYPPKRFVAFTCFYG